ncbi:MAG: hypothetical protein ABJP66_10455, partial [Hyphomicrobiales bacterium]
MVSISFDEAFYLRENPDVAEAVARGEFSSAREHFDSLGFQEGRDPSVHFDTSFYLEQNPDVAAAGVNPLDHFNTSGDGEARSPNSFFDAAYYLQQNPDVAEAGLSPFEHFQQYGASESRAPNATIASEIAGGFDEASYLGSNPDIAAAVANGEFQSGYHHWLLNGYTESRAGAQNTSGSPLSTASTPSGSPSEPEVPGGGGGGGGAPTPDAAALTGTTLVLAADTTLTLAGTSAIVAGPGVTTIVVELAGIESINLNGYKLQMSGETLDAIANAKGGAMIAIDGIASGGGALDITGVDFGNIAEGPLEAPNVAVFDFKGLTPEELVPENFTVNGSYGDAIKAFWVALDAGYYKALPLSNDEVNTNFFRLGNEYVDFLKGGNVALLDIGQTKVNLTPDYTDRQQTVHDNILGNLTDGSVAWRVGQGATDVRSDLTKIFENRPIPSGHDNSLEKFQEAKEWDAIIGVTRTDADIEIEIGKLSDIASDPLGGMWNGNPGHSNDHFRVVRNTDAEIELAIKAKIRADGDYGDSNRTDLLGESFYDNISPEGAVGLPPAWNVPGGEAPGRESESTARWSFDFSIATNIDTGNLKTPELADYQFKLVFDVDPTAGTSFVTLALDRTDGSDWLFESAENADVAAAMQQLLSGDLSNPYIGDNVGENDSSNPTYVSQNSQNYGFANGNEHLVNAFIGNAYNGDGTKIDSVNYWEAETHPGNFKIGLEAFTSNGSELLADSYINVGQELLIDLANGAGAGAAWQTDRRAVDSISTVANPEDNTDDVIAINIAESSETSGFHRFQGA